MEKNKKDYIANIEEFISAIPIVDNISSRLKFLNKEYILFVQKSETGHAICFLLTDA
jgi:hypothetical protein